MQCLRPKRGEVGSDSAGQLCNLDDADDNEQRTSAASDDCEHSLFSKHSCTPNAGSCSVGVSKTTVLDADTAAHSHDYGDDDDDEEEDDDADDDEARMKMMTIMLMMVQVMMMMLMLMPPRMFPFRLVRVTLALIENANINRFIDFSIDQTFD